MSSQERGKKAVIAQLASLKASLHNVSSLRKGRCASKSLVACLLIGDISADSSCDSECDRL